MWQVVEVSVGPNIHRGRYKTEGKRLILEWRGGRAVEWCGMLRPDVVATTRLRQLVSRPPLAA